MRMTGLARHLGYLVLVALTIVGCSSESTPPTAPPAGGAQTPAPPVPPTPTGPAGVLWGFVVDASGACIGNATAEIVEGTGNGQSVKQITPCGSWDYDGGFMFKDLIAGAALRVRASAPGYRTGERTFQAYSASRYSSVDIVLSKIE